jgi:hypothetical protein
VTNADYLDLRSGEREKLFFFMLNAYLCSRLDTRQESAEDEEVNVYMAHLLHSLVDGRFYVENAQVLADSPLDVYAKVAEHDSARHKFKVYRTNADHRLISFGLFSGLGGHQSLYRQATTPPETYLEQAQQYYGWAACFSARLPGRYQGLAAALHKLARNFATYRSILSHLGSHYCGLMQRLSAGELFHLERQVHQAALPGLRALALDQMLDAYSRWRRQPSAENRRLFQEACGRYQQLDPRFCAERLEGEAAN